MMESFPEITRKRFVFVAAALVTVLGGTTTADADEVRLVSGDVLNGEITERTESEIVLDHPVLGELRIPLEQVDSIDGVPLMGPPPPDDEPDGEPEIEEEEKEWKSHFEIGGSASFGNTDTQNLHLNITSVRETERMVTKLDASYFYGASNGDTTTNKATAGILNDWLIPDSRWFYFASGRYDYDQFQSWNHRVGGHGGVGYHLIQEETFILDLRAGAGATKEWGSEDNELRPEGLFGGDLAWQISPTQSFKLSTTIYPDLGDLGEYRWLTTADWSLLMDEASNMSLTAGLRNEYQSDVDPGFKHNDLYVFAGLRFDF